MHVEAARLVPPLGPFRRRLSQYQHILPAFAQQLAHPLVPGLALSFQYGLLRTQFLGSKLNWMSID